MFHPFVLFVALRYMRVKRRNRFASFVSFVSVAGIALGVGALIIVLSVMNGFEREVIRHVLGMSSHAVLVEGDERIEDWPGVRRAIVADPRVAATAPYVRGSGMLSRKGRVTGVVVEGIDPAQETAVTDISRYVQAAALAALEPGHSTAVIGDGLAHKLGSRAGDTVTLVVPEWDAAGGARAPRYVRLKIAATFHTGMHQFDGRLVLVHLADARAVFRMGEAVSGARLRFTDPDLAPAAARDLALALGPGHLAIDWTQYHRNFFLALASQKRIMFVVLVLIVAVAAFNIAANMIMMVTEKTSDIAVLRTLGATRARIVVLFLVQGLLLGTLGALLGVGLGAWGASESETVARLLEGLLGIDLVNAEVYFIDYLPAELRAADLAGVVGASLLLSTLATLYPALRAAAIQPARAIHYE
jgi:lipoprotein-releasing system permease protein